MSLGFGRFVLFVGWGRRGGGDFGDFRLGWGKDLGVEVRSFRMFEVVGVLVSGNSVGFLWGSGGG